MLRSDFVTGQGVDRALALATAGCYRGVSAADGRSAVRRLTGRARFDPGGPERLANAVSA